LKKCDEFKDVDEFVILKLPVIDDCEKVVQSQTYKLEENTKFKKRVFLYNISLTPEIFDPQTLQSAVKDGASISPTLYDLTTFKPYTQISLSVSPEDIQDNFELKKAELHELLNKILENPGEYRIKGKRDILVRGIFESFESGGQVFNNEIVDILPRLKCVGFWL